MINSHLHFLYISIEEMNMNLVAEADADGDGPTDGRSGEKARSSSVLRSQALGRENR